MVSAVVVSIGSVFFLYTFWHFFVDWIFQSQWEAMKKSSSWKHRAFHCNIYTFLFTPMLALTGLRGWGLVFAMVVLWVAHFLTDTYIPVYLWAKYIRKIPELQNGSPRIVMKGLAQQPLYFMLFVMADQLFHLVPLFALATVVVVGA